MEPDRKDIESWIQSSIRDYVEHSTENHLNDPEKERAFDTPLVGFADGGDALFDAYKQHVGPFHWTPLEIFNQTFPDNRVKAQDLSVICWILPQTRATKADNRKQNRYPAQRWSRARTFGEEFNAKVRQHVVHTLAAAGIRSVAPMLSPNWEKKESPQHGYASTWSERHAAYACGLGTFGLSDGLITPLGKAIRVGSVVAVVRLAPSPRPYNTHQAYCLFHTMEKCGKCIDRCPAGAISEAGHDKVKCKAYIQKKAMPFISNHYGFEGKGCGLCQTKVPCESKIPMRQETK
jgi:epoxyqueuosine reductase QueG